MVMLYHSTDLAHAAKIAKAGEFRSLYAQAMAAGEEFHDSGRKDAGDVSFATALHLAHLNNGVTFAVDVPPTTLEKIIFDKQRGWMPKKERDTEFTKQKHSSEQALQQIGFVYIPTKWTLDGLKQIYLNDSHLVDAWDYRSQAEREESGLNRFEARDANLSELIKSLSRLKPECFLGSEDDDFKWSFIPVTEVSPLEIIKLAEVSVNKQKS